MPNNKIDKYPITVMDCHEYIKRICDILIQCDIHIVAMDFDQTVYLNDEEKFKIEALIFMEEMWKRGAKVAIATHRTIFDKYEAFTGRLSNELIDDMFCVAKYDNNVYSNKNQHIIEIFNHYISVVKQKNTRVNNIILFDDLETNISAAIMAGFYAIHINCNTGLKLSDLFNSIDICMLNLSF